MAMYRDSVSQEILNEDAKMDLPTELLICPFARDVEKGLTATPKKLFSKYFYDATGSRIFQEIMEMPEYYLTNAELEILKEQSAAIYEALGFVSEFNIVELGAGDGVKTKAFLKFLIENNIAVTYHPVDISQEAMNILESDLNESLSSLNIQPLVGDYFEVLNSFDLGDRPSFFLFLGGNIGNYESVKARELLQHFGQFMKKGDRFLIGMDLKKNPRTIINAYDDPHGITRRFNLNLLARMNRDLGANFEPDQFDFYAHYNPVTGDVRSYLVSLVQQKVWIEHLEETFSFEENEVIFTELSKKYSLKEVECLAMRTGFRALQHFTDSNNYFVDSLWGKE